MIKGKVIQGFMPFSLTFYLTSMKKAYQRY